MCEIPLHFVFIFLPALAYLFARATHPSRKQSTGSFVQSGLVYNWTVCQIIQVRAFVTVNKNAVLRRPVEHRCYYGECRIFGVLFHYSSRHLVLQLAIRLRLVLL